MTKTVPVEHALAASSQNWHQASCESSAPRAGRDVSSSAQCSRLLETGALCRFALLLAASFKVAAKREPSSSGNPGKTVEQKSPDHAARRPSPPAKLQLETKNSLSRRMIENGTRACALGPTLSGATCARRHEMVARCGLIGYCHPSMELLAEIFIVIGAMLPGIITVILEVSSQRLLSALVWTSFSVGLGLTATGILMLRRSLMKLLAEIFVIIGAMLPGMATVILEVSLHRPLSVVVGASLSMGSGLVAAGILMLRRQKRL